jgi:hypothetical protein
MISAKGYNQTDAINRLTEDTHRKIQARIVEQGPLKFYDNMIEANVRDKARWAEKGLSTEGFDANIASFQAAKDAFLAKSNPPADTFSKSK